MKHGPIFAYCNARLKEDVRTGSIYKGTGASKETIRVGRLHWPPGRFTARVRVAGDLKDGTRQAEAYVSCYDFEMLETAERIYGRLRSYVRGWIKSLHEGVESVEPL